MIWLYLSFYTNQTTNHSSRKQIDRRQNIIKCIIPSHWIYACCVLLDCNELGLLRNGYFEMVYRRIVLHFLLQFYNIIAFIWSLSLLNVGLACVCLVVFVYVVFSSILFHAILLLFNWGARAVFRIGPYFSTGRLYHFWTDFYGIGTKWKNHTTPWTKRYLLCANFSIFTLAHARTHPYTCSNVYGA